MPNLITKVNSYRAAIIAMLRSCTPWLICLAGVLYYCYNYFLRVSPSVLQQQLMAVWHINAAQFGSLAACYYYAYAPMQIPAGILHDRFGPRLVMFCSCLIAVLGLALFVHADTVTGVAVGRCLIGLGASCAYTGTLKLIANCLPQRYFATAVGMTATSGMLAGMLTQNYLPQAMARYGCMLPLNMAIIIGLLLSVILSTLPSDLVRTNLMRPHYTLSDLGMHLVIILRKPQIWLIGIISCLTYLPATAFLDLWGIPFLAAVYHYSTAKAAQLMSWGFMGWIIGAPLIGIISDRLQQQVRIIFIASLVAAAALFAICLLQHINPSVLAVVLFLMGVSCGAHSLCFSYVKAQHPTAITATVIAVVNTVNMSGGAILQPLIGKLIDWHAGAQVMVIAGVPQYSSSDYMFALTSIPIAILIAGLLCKFLNDES